MTADYNIAPSRDVTEKHISRGFQASTLLFSLGKKLEKTSSTAEDVIF